MSTISKAGKKPLIGITTWRRDLPTFLGEKTDLYTLDPEYSNYVELAGGIPILLPHSVESVDAYLDVLDGLIVSGGSDIDPNSYGQENQGLSYDVKPEVDRFELALIRRAQAKKVPTLGICRGFQMMQVAFGGTMLQDLHDQYPEHPKNEGGPDYILGLRHSVTFAKDSVLAKAYGSSNRIVNTIHHQCVQTIGSGFLAVGWSEDGIIEATESETDWFALGVQWHPEKMKDITELKLFHSFIQYAQRQMQPRGSNV